MNVRLYDADKAGLDLSCIDFRDVPQVAVEAILAGREHAQLRATLAAVDEEHLGIEHLASKLRREWIGEGLAGAKRRPILGRQDADLALRDADLRLVGVHIIEDVDQEPGMEAGR